MRITEYLDKMGIKYKVTEHRPTFTAQEMATEEHESGMCVAKPVIVRADGKYYMCVLPAPYKIDMDVLKSRLGAKDVELAEEKDMAKLFPDCALGAEPPFGNLYDLPTIMDKVMEADEHILFQAGSHEKAVRVSMADYKRLVKPKVLQFSYHAT
jgi:Ala-tRNA(Pro) deacylase